MWNALLKTAVVVFVHCVFIVVEIVNDVSSWATLKPAYQHLDCMTIMTDLPTQNIATFSINTPVDSHQVMQLLLGRLSVVMILYKVEIN